MLVVPSVNIDDIAPQERAFDGNKTGSFLDPGQNSSHPSVA